MGLHHIGACADDSRVKILGIGHIDDGHGRISQITRQVVVGLGQGNGNGACVIVGLYLCFKSQELLRIGRSVLAFLADPVQRFLDLAGRHLCAVGEGDPVTDLDGPDSGILIDLIGFCQPRLNLHVVVELEQGFADTKSHAVPAGVCLRSRIDQTVRIHLTPKGQHLLIVRPCVPGKKRG